MARNQLKSLFGQLPKPKNDFEIVVPEAASKTESRPKISEDAEDVSNRQQRLKKEKEDKEWRLRSSALQRDLPRPLVIVKTQALDDIEQLILDETQKLMCRDAQ